MDDIRALWFDLKKDLSSSIDQIKDSESKFEYIEQHNVIKASEDDQREIELNNREIVISKKEMALVDIQSKIESQLKHIEDNKITDKVINEKTNKLNEKIQIIINKEKDIKNIEQSIAVKVRELQTLQDRESKVQIRESELNNKELDYQHRNEELNKKEWANAKERKRLNILDQQLNEKPR